MQNIGAFEAKTQLSRLLRDVERNKDEIVIHRHRRNIACLVPFSSYQRTCSNRRLDILAELKEIRDQQKLHKSPSVKTLVNEGRKR